MVENTSASSHHVVWLNQDLKVSVTLRPSLLMSETEPYPCQNVENIISPNILEKVLLDQY